LKKIITKKFIQAIVIAWTSEFIPKMAYRSIELTNGNLDGYVNWTLSTFLISGYNATGIMPTNFLPNGSDSCR
jgi:hypothetical protein